MTGAREIAAGRIRWCAHRRCSVARGAQQQSSQQHVFAEAAIQSGLLTRRAIKRGALRNSAKEFFDNHYLKELEEMGFSQHLYGQQ